MVIVVVLPGAGRYEVDESTVLMLRTDSSALG